MRLPYNGHREFGASPIRSDAMLKPFILLIIVLVAGPDLFAFVELTTLLEVLGATLFVIAFAVGFKLLGIRVLDWLRRLLVPEEYSMLIRMRGRPSAVVVGVLY